MKKRLKTFWFILLFVAFGSHAFGRIGHDAVAYIAECNLTPKAKSTIEKYLGGRSIVYYASWMDYVRLTPEYKYSDGWHSASVDSLGNHKLWKERYEAYTGINTVMNNVENGKYKSMPDSAVAVSIKLLVHMIGDMHCPSHTFFEGKTQGINFYLGSVKKRFHKFWDEDIFELAHKWLYEDYRYQLDRLSPKEKEKITNGSLIDWIEGNARTIRPVYDILTPERKFDKAEVSKLVLDMGELTDNQILKAGHRLAHVLNSIFDPKYPKWER